MLVLQNLLGRAIYDDDAVIILSPEWAVEGGSPEYLGHYTPFLLALIVHVDRFGEVKVREDVAKDQEEVLALYNSLAVDVSESLADTIP